MKTGWRVIFIILSLIPPIYLIIRSISGLWAFPELLPRQLSFRALEFMADNRRPLVRSLISSVSYSGATVFLCTLISMPAAHVLARRDLRGKDIIELMILAPLLVPAVVFALGLYPLFLRAGISDSFFGVVLVLSLSSFPYMFRALYSGFLSYTEDLENCAAMLGAGSLKRIVSVHIPQLLPALLSGGMVVFLVAFTEYFLVFLIGGGLVPSYSGYLVPLIRASDWTISAALILIFITIPVTLYGILEGALKRYYRKRGLFTGEF